MRTKVFLIGIFVSFAIWTNAQTNSFELRNGDPVWTNNIDQYQYPSEDFREYFLEFSVNELAQIKSIRVELVITSAEGRDIIIKSETYSSSNLIQNYKSEDLIRISFGNLEIANYTLSIQKEKVGKRFENKITKTISQ